MLNFTSALYLGLHHPSASLRPWSNLTLGVPAALAEPSSANSVAVRVARLVGCERALLAPSTLHLFWDVFGTAAFHDRPVLLDEGTYPIARWGVERAASRGAPVVRFQHHNPGALRAQLGRTRRRPVVVCDGLCPACGGAAPVREYAAAVKQLEGTLLIDDTQSLGVLGDRRFSNTAYGAGGGGVLRWSGIVDPGILMISSLAKGFGVPVAVLAGSHEAVGRFEQESETRVHCSPPSVATVRAAEHALEVNETEGDELRLRLLGLVRRFRKRLNARGLRTEGGLFPVQSLCSRELTSLEDLHERLLRSGIRGVLHRDRHDNRSRLSFLITAGHTPDEIDAAADAICRNATRVLTA